MAPQALERAGGFAGFRNWHQIPFLNAMPDRGFERHKITYHFFGDGPYCAVTGWPNMIQTITHDGWLGIPPHQSKITMKSLDFWRIENGLIRENWVLVDLLDMYKDIGVDVLARMREFNKARYPMNFRLEVHGKDCHIFKATMNIRYESPGRYLGGRRILCQFFRICARLIARLWV